MKVIKKAGNTIEADTTVGPQNSNGHEIITLHPKQSVITHITEGPVIGNRVITMEYRYAGDSFFWKGFCKR